MSYDDWKSTDPNDTDRFHVCPVCAGPSAGTDREPCSRACDEVMHAEQEEPTVGERAA